MKKINIGFKLNSIFNINYFLLFLLLIINFSYFLFETLDDLKKTIFYINLFLFIMFFIFNFIYRIEYNKGKGNIKKYTVNNNDDNDKLIDKILKSKIKYRENNEIYNLFKKFFIKNNLLNKDYQDLKNIFLKMVPEDFISNVNATGLDRISLGISIKKYLYVMFIDIIGFTTIAEKLHQDRTLLMLNIYFDGIVEIIKNYGGNVDKFLGDGMMVVFDGIKAENILKASIEIQNFISKFQISELGKEISVGIGINCGEVILGTIGSKDRMEITLIGDVVNTASRIESLTRTEENKILISNTFYNNIDNYEEFNIIDLGYKNLKGKKNNLKIYGVKPIINITI